MIILLKRMLRPEWWAEHQRIQQELAILRRPIYSAPRWTWRAISEQLYWWPAWVLAYAGWVACDAYARMWRHEKPFAEYGIHVYTGAQGQGKTASLVERLIRLRDEYPRAYRVCNFDTPYATHRLEHWRDFFEIRNGVDGVAFFIDELQNEWSSTEWQQLPAELLGELTQQRKQRVVIYATSPLFLRLAKPMREQSFTVIHCRTILGRLCVQRAYSAWTYEHGDAARRRPLYTRTYIQSDKIRQYDTYAKVTRMRKTAEKPKPRRKAKEAAE